MYLKIPSFFILREKKSRWKISFMCIEKTCQKEPIIEISSNCQGDLHFSLFSLNGSSEAPCKQLGLCIFDVDFLPRFTVGKWFSSLQNRQFSSELFILAWFLAILKLFLLIYWKYCPAELDRTSLKISTFKKKDNIINYSMYFRIQHWLELSLIYLLVHFAVLTVEKPIKT